MPSINQRNNVCDQTRQAALDYVYLQRLLARRCLAGDLGGGFACAVATNGRALPSHKTPGVLLSERRCLEAPFGGGTMTFHTADAAGLFPVLSGGKAVCRLQAWRGVVAAARQTGVRA